MSFADRKRMRAARYFEQVLERSAAQWSQGDYRSSKAAFDLSWPQIRGQLRWLVARSERDGEARELMGQCLISGRHALRSYVPARERRPWFEDVAGWPEPPGIRARALCELALCWIELGEAGSAVDCGREAYALATKHEDLEIQADALWSLGESQAHAGQTKEAAQTLSRCLSMRCEAYESTHPNVLEVACGLAAVWDDIGDHASVVRVLEPIVSALAESPAQAHPKGGACYRLLGVALARRGDLDPAERYCTRALALDRELLPAHHAGLAIALNDLAFVMHARGELERARDCLREALAVEELSSGESHPAVAFRLMNLGAVLRALGETQTALDVLERALALLRNAQGENHLHILHTLSTLGRCRLDVGEPAAAVAALTRAVELRRELYGDSDPGLPDERAALEAARGASRGLTDPG